MPDRLPPDGPTHCNSARSRARDNSRATSSRERTASFRSTARFSSITSAISCRDPEAASRALARAGFAPTPVSVQVNPDPGGGAPQRTGTGNVTAMFARGYIEVLFKTADTPLGRELEAGLARYPGVHLAAFAVADAAAAHRRLADRGFRVRPLVEMQRPVDTGGLPGTAAFTLARVEPGEMPEGRIQILTHRTEPMVWQPRWLSHPNGALALASIDDRGRRRGGSGAALRALHRTQGNAVTAGAGDRARPRPRRSRCTPMPSRECCPRFRSPSLPFAGAYGIKVRSLTALGDMLQRAGLESWQREQRLVAIFPEELGHGAWLFAE